MTPSNKSNLRYGLALAGNVTGIIVAIKRKSGFWGGVGWFIVGGMVGVAVGFIATSAMPDTTEVKDLTLNANVNVDTSNPS